MTSQPEDDGPRTQTVCVTFKVHPQAADEFKIVFNPNPAAMPEERFVGYINDVLTMSGEQAGTVARLMLSKHQSEAAAFRLTRQKRAAVGRGVALQMRLAIRDLRPNS
jgi:hypothetical protein